MKLKLSVFFILLACNASIALGQSFTGEVLDAETKEPIPFANVYFPDLKQVWLQTMRVYFYWIIILNVRYMLRSLT